ncbi:MAG: P-II family nitrogen regulator [Deltaproteobacteria bacterium]|nr:P-II family nitrogen regulator [Deltaproteobacteria bacterium]
MKLVEAIIKPVKLEEVKSALQQIGINEIMESALICHGRQKKQMMLYRGANYSVDDVKKTKLEIIAADDSVTKIVELIGNIAKTERKEDCRIFILPFNEAN